MEGPSMEAAAGGGRSSNLRGNFRLSTLVPRPRSAAVCIREAPPTTTAVAQHIPRVAISPDVTRGSSASPTTTITSSAAATTAAALPSSPPPRDRKLSPHPRHSSFNAHEQSLERAVLMVEEAMRTWQTTMRDLNWNRVSLQEELDLQRRLYAATHGANAHFSRAIRAFGPFEHSLVRWEVVKTVDHEYWDVLKELVSPNAGAFLEAAKHIPVADVRKFAQAMVNVAELCDHTLPLLATFISTEIDQTGFVGDLFRSNSVPSCMCTILFDRAGRTYLPTMLLDAMQSLLRSPDSFEVDPARMGSGPTEDDEYIQEKSRVLEELGVKLAPTPEELDLLEELQQNQGSLEDMCDAFLECMISSVVYAPRSMMMIAHMMQTLVTRRFPEARHTCVGGLFMLRYVCPKVLTHETWMSKEKKKLAPDPATRKRVQRNKILLTKVLQNMFNGVLFKGKEAHMGKLNAYVEAQFPRVRLFCDQFASPGRGGSHSQLQSVGHVGSIPVCGKSAKALTEDFKFLQETLWKVDLKKTKEMVKVRRQSSPRKSTHTLDPKKLNQQLLEMCRSAHWEEVERFASLLPPLAVNLAQNGCTPMHVSCERGLLPLVESLLDHGADEMGRRVKGGCICKTESKEVTADRPAHGAAKAGHVEVLDCLLGSFLQFARRGCPEAEACFVNQLGNKARTLMDHAVYCGQAPVVQWLLDKGANPNVTEGQNWESPLHQSALRGWTDIAGLLLQEGADAYAVNKDGKTSFDIAFQQGNRELCELFASKRISLNGQQWAELVQAKEVKEAKEAKEAKEEAAKCEKCSTLLPIGHFGKKHGQALCEKCMEGEISSSSARTPVGLAKAAASGGATCCGETVREKFCTECGKPAPTSPPIRTCCGRTLRSKFCEECGKKA